MHRIEKILSAIADPHVARLLRLASRAALQAGAILRDLECHPHEVTQKGRIDLVTEADFAAEKKILSLFAEHTPGITVLSEESAADFAKVSDAPCWVIDPLDGTTNYAHGLPWYAVSIACLVGRVPQLGVVYQVPNDCLFFTIRGAGAYQNEEKISVSGETELQNSLLATGFPYNVREEIDPIGTALLAVLPEVQGIRRAGSAALDLAHLAAGHLDGYWEVGLKPWDTAAGMLLVQEAGGMVSDIQGNAFDIFRGKIVATNGAIHDGLRSLLAKGPRG